ncbi:hypothetical protein RIF29_39540 [Crotalaria pallida]|uniref:Uncharacterized protein n=1 Tax=Crotalaria pallida TaxID=3830 RepID=A0AAN9E1C8_CROPI
MFSIVSATPLIQLLDPSGFHRSHFRPCQPIGSFASTKPCVVASVTETHTDSQIHVYTTEFIVGFGFPISQTN